MDDGWMDDGWMEGWMEDGQQVAGRWTTDGCRRGTRGHGWVEGRLMMGDGRMMGG